MTNVRAKAVAIRARPLVHRPHSTFTFKAILKDWSPALPKDCWRLRTFETVVFPCNLNQPSPSRRPNLQRNFHTTNTIQLTFLTSPHLDTLITFASPR